MEKWKVGKMEICPPYSPWRDMHDGGAGKVVRRKTGEEF